MKILLIDTELSGLRPYDEVIDFAGLLLNIDNDGHILSESWTFNSVVSGAIDILPSQTELTGLELNDISDPSLPNISDVRNALLGSDLDSRFIVCSYGLQFDLDWIYHSLRLNGTDTPLTVTGLCLMECVGIKFGKRISLDKFFNNTRETHRAKEDVLLHKEVLLKVLGMTLPIKQYSAKEPNVLA
ncbi:hypothetical protein M6C35_001952 [Vibrio metschnikovii]|nr:hypothetical protein [Vibrio metschnikovii]